MDKKRCIICEAELPIGEFYKHPKMGDGHLNKCKSCCKKQSNDNYHKKMSDSLFVESERIRSRVKNNTINKDRINKYFSKYPEKEVAKSRSRNIKVGNGMEKHHWSYNKCHHKDVIVLSVDLHKKVHRFIIYDQERMMYRRVDNNELLDTRESHIEYIISCVGNIPELWK